MFTATTRGIVVRVEPSYLPQESAPEDGRWVWAYHVTIENGGPLAVQLLSRRWLITDGRGVRREVNGLGVIGQQPMIPAGGSFDYASGCPLTTPGGFMEGQYRMVDEHGESFDVAIPAFSLDVPDGSRVLN
jgi:ApaG protein